VTYIRKDKGPEGCIDTGELASLRSRPRIDAASRPPRSNRARGGHGGGGRRREGGGGDAGERKRARGGRQVSELYAMAEVAVTVKREVFVTAGGKREVCLMGDRFDGVSRDRSRHGGRCAGLGGGAGVPCFGVWVSCNGRY